MHIHVLHHQHRIHLFAAERCHYQTSVDADTLKKLGMNLTCDPVYEETGRKYHKI